MNIPLTYWGAQNCTDFMPTSSLQIYYNANIGASYDLNYTGSGTNTRVGLINLANQQNSLGAVVTSPYSYSDYGLNTTNGNIDSYYPLNLYDAGLPATVLIRAKFRTNANYFILQNLGNSNEGIKIVNGYFTFARGVNECYPLPTASVAGFGSEYTYLLVGRGSGGNPYFKIADNNFTTQYTGSGTCILINDFDIAMDDAGYLQSFAVWNKELSQSEILASTRAMGCNAVPQGWNDGLIPPTASAASYRFYGGTSGATAYFLEPNDTSLTRLSIQPTTYDYACVCNTSSVLTTGGVGVNAEKVFDTCQVSSSTTFPNVEYLIVGGGGGGGACLRYAGLTQPYAGGGGGAGGFLTGSTTLAGSTTYPIVVGSGGLGGQSTSSFSPNYSNLQIAQNGQSSSAFGITSLGGGAGGTVSTGSFSGSISGSGVDGASGGGGAFGAFGGSGSVGQGNNGGRSGVINVRAAGGGGGASSNGENDKTISVSTYSGQGGTGRYWYQQLVPVSSLTDFAYGGGGGRVEGFGGLINGGTGAPGLTNTGGGGDGGAAVSPTFYNGGTGGSGYVAIRYNGGPQATGGVIEQKFGMTYHYFTASANLIT